MNILIYFAATISVAMGASIFASDDRIIGGKETTIEEYPYQVSLRYDGEHSCGGSIINENTILTAAHCVHFHVYELLTVRLGSTIHHQGQEYKIAEVIEHPEYDSQTVNNDIAVLKLAEPIKYSTKAQPIPLQQAGITVPEGTTSFVSGWGLTNASSSQIPEILHAVDVNVITNEECKNSYEDYTITSSMLCAKAPGHDSCQMDSGGPLVANGKLIGVVSFGVGCADPNYPGVYANVSTLHDFIDKYL